jgi:hypothetical protein
VFLPTANAEETVEAVRWAAGGAFSVDVVAPETVAMAYYRQPEGRRLLHLVNYDAAKPVSAVAISLAQPFKAATLISPDEREPVRLQVDTRDGRTTVQVPRLKTYSVLELTP